MQPLISTSVAIFGLICLGTCTKSLLDALRSPLNKVPGPWYARFTNLRLKLAVITGQRIYYIDSLHRKYGPYVRVAPSEVAVNDPKAIKAIHGVTSGFEKTRWYGELVNVGVPTLFTMQSAKQHAARRRLFARGVSKTNIRAHWEGVMKGKIELAVTKIMQESSATGQVDILKWWTFMASDVSSHLFIGQSFRTLEAGEVNEYIRALTSALMGGGIGLELRWVRAICKTLPIQAAQQLFNSQGINIDHASIAIQNTRASQESRNIFANIAAEAEKGETLDDRDVALEAMSLFVAGTDTTAVSLTYLIWAVLSRPNLRMQIEAELQELPPNFTDADVESRCPLLNATIEETLRLYGAAPGSLPRDVPEQGAELNGYYLPPGLIVSTHAYCLHRDPALFPDPLTFKPSRWLPDSQDKASDAAKAALMPFGAGSRGCLGVHIAYMELRLGAAEFFRRCPGSVLASSTTDDSMTFENFFLIAPRSHRCDVVAGKSTQ